MNSSCQLSAECLNCHLPSEGFFCALSQISRDAFNKIKHAAVFPRVVVIFVEGQTPRGVFLLCQGQAKVSTASRDGKALILRIANPGVVLGLDAIVTGKPYQVTVETMQPSQLHFVSGEDFLLFLKQHSDACLRAVQQIGRDCGQAYDVIRSIGLSHSVTGRVAKFLLASAMDEPAMNGVVRVRLTLTHEDIAQLTGTSRETITRILSGFRKQRIVELKGSILIIHDQHALERLVAS
ncbi:MAG: Crp/Fnr family transcriptional regulator [Acidobacteria bacterium]|nr:MAG: Crp/Fnr family transcriptional regulator [Acidobacteriota bacterium]